MSHPLLSEYTEKIKQLADERREQERLAAREREARTVLRLQLQALQQREEEERLEEEKKKAAAAKIEEITDEEAAKIKAEKGKEKKAEKDGDADDAE